MIRDRFFVSFGRIYTAVIDINIENKEISDLIDKAIGQYYDLETISRCTDLGCMSMSPRDLRQFAPRKYKNVRLMNINGLATGQLHFITEDGHYLLIPWCYVISMTPSKEMEK